jgi:spoIIIJ-associated protein
MQEACQRATEFLDDLLKDLGFRLEVTSEITDAGCQLNMSGDDAHFALAENGEILDAFETILFQAFGRDIDKTQRFVCDAEGFRATRKKELYAMAHFAADQVRKNGRAFTFGLLNSTERRIIHTSLKDESDLITESVGDGKERRLQVRLQ